MFISTSVLLLLRFGQENSDAVRFLLVRFIKMFFFFPKGQTDLTTVSEIGIVIVHFVYLKNKIGIL